MPSKTLKSPLLVEIPKSQNLILQNSPSFPIEKSPCSSTKKERTLTIDTHSQICPSTVPVMMSPVCNIEG